MDDFAGGRSFLARDSAPQNISIYSVAFISFSLESSLPPRPVALGSLAQSLSRPASPQPPSQDLRRPYLPIERSLSQSSLARRHFFRLSFPPTLLPKDPALELSLPDDLLQTYPS